MIHFSRQLIVIDKEKLKGLSKKETAFLYCRLEKELNRLVNSYTSQVKTKPFRGMKKMTVSRKIKDTGLLRIGDLARAAGEAVSTIRFWTDQGLLSVKAYSKGGYQLYEPSAVGIARRIRNLEEGKRMTIEEIRRVVSS